MKKIRYAVRVAGFMGATVALLVVSAPAMLVWAKCAGGGDIKG